jgi:Flp pilus assembly CpaE family ATPase
MSNHITGNLGMSPFLKQEKAVENLRTLVGKGIAFNVEQRAFLDTISEKIATTFEATDASLLKLVRIQQADSTAARLGMESALTAFLNNMYETTEYMTEAADSIRASIYEASALMTAEEATDFEYQVQK